MRTQRQPSALASDSLQQPPVLAGSEFMQCGAAYLQAFTTNAIYWHKSNLTSVVPSPPHGVFCLKSRYNPQQMSRKAGNHSSVNENHRLPKTRCRSYLACMRGRLQRMKGPSASMDGNSASTSARLGQLKNFHSSYASLSCRSRTGSSQDTDRKVHSTASLISKSTVGTWLIDYRF